MNSLLWAFVFFASASAPSQQSSAPQTAMPDINGGSMPPALLYYTGWAPPKECKKIAAQTVSVNFIVGTNGEVTDPQIESGSEEVKRCAVAMLNQRRFSPETKADVPLSVRTHMQLEVGSYPTRPVAIHTEDPSPKCIPKEDSLRAEIEILVTVEGLPSREALLQSSGNPCWDQASIASVQGYRFRPATFHGKPVPMLLHIDSNFSRSMH